MARNKHTAQRSTRGNAPRRQLPFKKVKSLKSTLRKPHHLRSGTVAIRDIYCYIKSIEIYLIKLLFQRYVG